MDSQLRPTSRQEKDILALQNASIVLFVNSLAKWMGYENLTPGDLDLKVKLPAGTTAAFLRGGILPQRKTIQSYAEVLGLNTEALWVDFTQMYDEDVVYPT